MNGPHLCSHFSLFSLFTKLACESKPRCLLGSNSIEFGKEFGKKDLPLHELSPPTHLLSLSYISSIHLNSPPPPFPRDFGYLGMRVCMSMASWPNHGPPARQVRQVLCAIAPPCVSRPFSTFSSHFTTSAPRFPTSSLHFFTSSPHFSTSSPQFHASSSYFSNSSSRSSPLDHFFPTLIYLFPTLTDPFPHTLLPVICTSLPPLSARKLLTVQHRLPLMLPEQLLVDTCVLSPAPMFKLTLHLAQGWTDLLFLGCKPLGLRSPNRPRVPKQDPPPPSSPAGPQLKLVGHSLKSSLHQAPQVRQNVRRTLELTTPPAGP